MCRGHQRTTLIARLAERRLVERSSTRLLRRIKRRRRNMQPRKALRTVVRKATTRTAEMRTTTLARRRDPQGRRRDHPLITPITLRRRHLLRAMARLAQPVTMAEEMAERTRPT